MGMKAAKFGFMFQVLSLIVGLFFAALMYLQSQNPISVNWDNIQFNVTRNGVNARPFIDRYWANLYYCWYL